MTGFSAVIGTDDESSGAPPLELRPSPATAALTEALRLALLNVRDALTEAGNHNTVDHTAAATCRQLRFISGAFRFCGARSQHALCELMLDVIVAAGERASSSAHHALDCACSALLAALPSLQQGRAVPAGWLLPAWRALAAQVPGPAPSAAAMISLAVADESPAAADDGSWPSCTSPQPAPEISTTLLDTMLLDLLRAETGSDALRASLRAIRDLITAVMQKLPDHRHRLRWSVLPDYCELLVADAPMDVALAKKNLSAAIRGIRQAVQQCSLPAATLPDRLLRDVVFQIGLFAPVNAASQRVRDGFMLDWQLSLRSDGPGIDQVPEQRDALLARFDELESEWARTGRAERDRQITAITGALRAMSSAQSLALIAASLQALQEGDVEDDLPLVAGLLIARAAVQSLGEYDSAQRLGMAARALAALEALVQQADGAAMNERWWWDRMSGLAPGLQHPAAMAALRDAVRSVFADAEQKLDLMIESGDTAAALREMSLSLDRASGALTVAGASTAVRLVAALGQELRLAEQAAASTMADPFSGEAQTLTLQWVRLCEWVDAWPAGDRQQHEQQQHEQPHDPVLVAKSVLSPDPSAQADLSASAETDSRCDGPQDRAAESLPDQALPRERLEQIFIQEATQRLSHLRQALSGWMADGALRLPAAIASEAHGLAGSSATVGRQRLHDGALALEQAVDHLARLPAASQHPHADTLLQSVQALEHELQRTPSPSADAADHGGEPIAEAVDALSMLSQRQSEHSVQPVPVHDDAAGQPVTDADALSADAELLAVFSEEAAELLPLLAKQMDDWLLTPQDDGLRSGALRLLHTLKGSARMAGQIMLGERLHRMEHDIAQLARLPDPQAPDLFALRDELAQLLAEAGLAPECEAPPDCAASSSLLFTTAAPQSEPSAPERSLTEASGAAPRLRNDLLERASASAAELLVGAVRANEEQQRQRQTVSELAENLVRLRTQLRELELQSESRIAAHAHPGASAFDPLEFDRYTRLQELTRMTAESLADLTSLQRTLGRQADSAAAMLSQQTRYARSLQSDLRRAGMQAFSGIELRLRHLARQVAGETGREVRFELEGAQIEIDRQQLDRLSGALQHLLRNAIVHGIESPPEREQAGKPRCGVVRLSLSQQGGELRLQISDDGRGLDFARIRNRALELGVLDEHAALDDAQLAELIFHPGLSTAEEITGLAGRGIGMDAVKEAVLQMGGALKVDSLSGAGTCITLGLPQLLSTQQVLVVSAGDISMALPASMVQHLMQPHQTVLRQALQNAGIEWQRQTMPLRHLGELLGLNPASATASAHRASVVILRQLDQWLAIMVGEVLGHREVVVKQAGSQLAGVPGLAGATLQADGSVLLIMNPLQWFDHLAQHRRLAQMPASPDQILDNAPLVMVVDDSLTVRRVSQRLLERHGYRVAVARHGTEALEQLREMTPAAMLLDIEMPRMDGFELLGRMRADARLKSVPVAMVTSRAAERHRSHAMQLGANAYFGKPYRDQELFGWLASCAPVPQHVASAA